MIELINLCKTYANGVQALNNINLRVEAGEIYGIIGKSGAGKSTLIRCVNLLEQPTSGQVFVNGQELTRLSKMELRQARHKIGMIFQHFNILHSATVYDNIALPLVLSHLSKQQVYQTVMPLLELTGLTERKDHYPAELSGGQKQRVAIARALANRPKLLLCDEATSALDPHTTSAILELLKTINQQLNLTILLITHEMEVVKSICNRVAILEHGSLIEETTATQLITHPQTPIAKEFVRTILKQDLPNYLQRQISPEANDNSYPIWRIWFHGKSSCEPLTSHLIHKLGLEINILQANLEHIQNQMIGIMLVEAIADKPKLAAGMEYLHNHGLKVEVLGYVNRID